MFDKPADIYSQPTSPCSSIFSSDPGTPFTPCITISPSVYPTACSPGVQQTIAEIFDTNSTFISLTAPSTTLTLPTTTPTLPITTPTLPTTIPTLPTTTPTLPTTTPTLPTTTPNLTITTPTLPTTTTTLHTTTPNLTTTSPNLVTVMPPLVIATTDNNPYINDQSSTSTTQRSPLVTVETLAPGTGEIISKKNSLPSQVPSTSARKLPATKTTLLRKVRLDDASAFIPTRVTKTAPVATHSRRSTHTNRSSLNISKELAAERSVARTNLTLINPSTSEKLVPLSLQLSTSPTL